MSDALFWELSYRVSDSENLIYIQPNKPNQNSYIERCTAYRTEVLNLHLFSSLRQVRDQGTACLISYKDKRPLDSLGRMPPAKCLLLNCMLDGEAYVIIWDTWMIFKKRLEIHGWFIEINKYDWYGWDSVWLLSGLTTTAFMDVAP